MTTFLKIYFWIALISLVINLLTIVVSDFPKKREDSLGFYIFKVLVAMPLLMWVAYLLWA